MPDNKKDLIYINKAYTPKPEAEVHYPHTNNGHELYLMIEGDVSFSIDGQFYSLEPYDLLIIGEKEVHRVVLNSNIPYQRIYIYFDPGLIAKFNTPRYNLLQIFENRKQGFGNKIKNDLIKKNDIPDYFEKIYEWSKTDLPEKDAMMTSILIQLIVKLTNIYFYVEEVTKVKDDVKYNAKIYDILNYITLNINKKITLDELESVFFINKFYLCHLFKDATGYTVNEYITRRKVSFAKELLKKDYSVNNVCSQLGFDDYSNFYRVFKKYTGMSPSNYQKESMIR